MKKNDLDKTILENMSNKVARFYDGGNVAVFGGAGMVGTKLVGYLLEVGANVWVIDNFSRGRQVHPGANYFVKDPGAYFMYTSVSGKDLLSRTRVNYGADGADASSHLGFHLEGFGAVFNLAAAVAGVMHNSENHLQMYQDNVNLLSGPLRAAVRGGVRNFLQTSSVCVYAPHHQTPSFEKYGFVDSPHEANAGYSEAKRDGERMLSWSGIERPIVVRPSNTIGEYDYYDSMAHVIPSFIKRAHHSIANKEPFVVYGDPSAYREFIYSGDVAAGMMHALALGESGEAYNLGTSQWPSMKVNVITMISLARRIIGAVGDYLGVDVNVEIKTDQGRGGGDPGRYSDSSKLGDLGWSHQVTLFDAIWVMIQDYMDRVAIWETGVPSHLLSV